MERKGPGFTVYTGSPASRARCTCAAWQGIQLLSLSCLLYEWGKNTHPHQLLSE